jgi:hypothetical protein
LIISFEDVRMMVNQQTDLIVYNHGNPLPFSFKECSGNRYFDGESNPIEFVGYFILTFICKFRYERYPFDKQECGIEV